MKIQQLIEAQKKELDELLEGGQLTLEGNGITPVDVTQEIKSFMKSYGRKLIEALGEELINTKYKCERGLDEEGAEYDLCDFCSAIFSHKEEQRLKLKEIISSLGK